MTLSVPTQLKLLDRLAARSHDPILGAVAVNLVKDTQALAAQEGHTLSEDQALDLLREVEETPAMPALTALAPAGWARPATLDQWAAARAAATQRWREARKADFWEGIWLLALPVVVPIASIVGLSWRFGFGAGTVLGGLFGGLVGSLCLIAILIKLLYNDNTLTKEVKARVKERRWLNRSPLAEEEVREWMNMPGMAETLLHLLDSPVPFLNGDRQHLERQYATFKEEQAHEAHQQKMNHQHDHLRTLLRQHLAALPT